MLRKIVVAALLYLASLSEASYAGPSVATGMQPATINSFHATGQGIEGHWTGSGGGGCTVTLHFAAVQIVNN